MSLTDLMPKGIFVTKFGGAGGALGAADFVRMSTEALTTALAEPRLVARGRDFPLTDAHLAYAHLAGRPRGKTLVTP